MQETQNTEETPETTTTTTTEHPHHPTHHVDALILHPFPSSTELHVQAPKKKEDTNLRSIGS